MLVESFALDLTKTPVAKNPCEDLRRELKMGTYLYHTRNIQELKYGESYLKIYLSHLRPEKDFNNGCSGAVDACRGQESFRLRASFVANHEHYRDSGLWVSQREAESRNPVCDSCTKSGDDDTEVLDINMMFHKRRSSFSAHRPCDNSHPDLRFHQQSRQNGLDALAARSIRMSRRKVSKKSYMERRGRFCSFE